MGRHDAEAVLHTGVVARQEPGEREGARAERALRQLHPVDADAVEVVLAGCRHHCLHEERLRTEGAVHGGVQCERISSGGQLQPLQLLCRADELLVLSRNLWQRLEEVVRLLGLRRGRSARAALPAGVCEESLDKLTHDIAHLSLGLFSLLLGLPLCLVNGLLLLLWEVGVQEAREDPLGTGYAHARIVGVHVAKLRHCGGRSFPTADRTLRNPVFARLVCNGAEHKALPTETVVARELNHVGDGIEADGALLRFLLKLKLWPGGPLSSRRQLFEHKHVAQ
mmetsp:Transcript_41622/g.88721  ORF Transcript_41622/g.88721 Transcript_41622/m.88721 type:complete len:281 (+) Transcript_41622:656-1498(+)